MSAAGTHAKDEGGAGGVRQEKKENWVRAEEKMDDRKGKEGKGNESGRGRLRAGSGKNWNSGIAGCTLQRWNEIYSVMFLSVSNQPGQKVTPKVYTCLK